MKRPIVVYLDSCDYSNLSYSKLDALQTEQLNALRAIKNYESVIFVYSGAHISEMSPLERKYADSALVRTRLMVELCGRSTMISYDRLMKAELKCLLDLDPKPVNVINNNGEWFPELGSLVSPLEELKLNKMMEDELDKKNLNRKARRMAKATMLKGSGFRGDYEKRFGKLDTGEVISRIPMRPDDAIVINRYLIGKATRKQADDAFLESLRDPTFMSQWFSSRYDQMSTITEWIRRPAQELLNNCNQTLKDFSEKLIGLDDAERARAIKGVSGEGWRNYKMQGVLNIVNKLLLWYWPGARLCVDVALIEKYCPGIWVCVNAFYDSIQKSIGAKGRSLKSSDFVDMIHSLYVPYVSFFRADRYMCGILQPLAKGFETRIVASSAELVPLLYGELRR
ncbi:hypothetical protein ACQKEF_13260 [Pseudomonas oryzihabitans]|uniref:hypothetical protein n=1 Tax=Pseudomonas oryzihabitans TaxID=47885 RepID=UPI003D054071